jgi:DNA-binding transcriptional MocR family regulator
VGLAKCIGAGLRLAYVVAPDPPAAWSFNSAMRALCVMASPISAAVATRWINDGTADTILRFIRSESIVRERIAAKALEPGSYLSDPLSFNIWLPMRNGWTRSVFVSQARTSGLGVVPSDAFAANGAPPEAVRRLGGANYAHSGRAGLAFLSHLLERQPESVAT